MPRPGWWARLDGLDRGRRGVGPMGDVVFVAMTVAVFVLLALLVKAVERL